MACNWVYNHYSNNPIKYGSGTLPLKIFVSVPFGTTEPLLWEEDGGSWNLPGFLKGNFWGSPVICPVYETGLGHLMRNCAR